MQFRRRRFIPTHVGNTRARRGSACESSVHPHARGEHTQQLGFAASAIGSSPRTWGTRHWRVAGARLHRFIPTHVGNTAQLSCRRTRPSVHPHARGEHTVWTSKIRVPYGSSPRTWGTRHQGRSPGVALRFIPTHVGNTGFDTSHSARGAVHPHARGEHYASRIRSQPRVGSSPRTWGTLLHPDAEAAGRRFIPTHVGNTSRRTTRWRRPAVHPHARGEHPARRSTGGSNYGSSPRTWGTPTPRRSAAGRPRFIPTHVGNTVASSRSPLCSAVHPHARGEHAATIRAWKPSIGSSPRTWGTPLGIRRQGSDDRFIPTHVGNTTSPRGRASPTSVHPHARGEHG